MEFSLLPLYVIIVFAFSAFITYRAKNITTSEAKSIYFLLFVLFIWTLIVIFMGMQGMHVSLIEKVPLLWQPFIPILIAVLAFLLSQTLQNALYKVIAETPQHWLTFFQALRIGALGGVIKGFQGEITSSFVFWVGIPDFLFGVSALLIGAYQLKHTLNNRLLLTWNLIGAAIILVPLVVLMHHFMNEPGFIFIFQFPMVLAPSIVVPLFVSFNLLTAWKTASD